ncbi:MAG: DUF359 domain-containing protein [Thermofilaceae archaeon]
MNQLRLKSEYRNTLRLPTGLALYKPPQKAVEILREVSEILKPPLVISVGDVVTTNLLLGGLKPAVAIIDFKSKRHEYNPACCTKLTKGYIILTCKNDPGTLSQEAINTVEKAIKEAIEGRNVMVITKGEEDLLALPAIITAPKGSFVIYGLWLGAAVAVISHPRISSAVERFIRIAFESIY